MQTPWLESPSSEAVHGHNGNDNTPGAQTERRGATGTGELSDSRRELTGRPFPDARSSLSVRTAKLWVRSLLLLLPTFG
jgi:hypothetical protein